MHIREATLADIQTITQIYNESVAERTATCDLTPKTVEDRAEWFKQFGARYPIFVGDQDGEVVCYGAVFRYNPREGYRFTVEHSLYVKRAARGKGLGRRMLRHLVKTARHLDYHYLEAKVFAHNAASLALHQGEGFEIVGIQKEIANIDGNWRDNAILALRL